MVFGLPFCQSTHVCWASQGTWSLFSVLWSPVFGGGEKKVEHGKMLRHFSSGNAGKRDMGALAAGGTLGSKIPEGSSPERHG